jgi:hypothetical protein
MQVFQRCRQLGAAVGISISISLFAASAFAASIKFTPQVNLNGGAIIGRIPIEKFDKLTLPRGRAYFKSNIVEITAIPEWQFDRQIVLSGPILKSWSAVQGNTATINGIAYFQDGDWLKYIDVNKPDQVVTTGDVFSGQITAMKSGFIEVTQDSGSTVQVKIADIQQIISPRAYKFSVPVTVYSNSASTAPSTSSSTSNTSTSNSAPTPGVEISGESTIVNLKPTTSIIALHAMKKDPLLKGDGDLSKAQLTAIWAGISSVEVLQLLPLAILEGPVRRELVQQYHSRINQQGQFSNIQSQLGLQFPNSSIAPGAALGTTFPAF